MDLIHLKENVQKYIDRLPVLTPDQIVDFKYNESDLENVYVVAFFSFGLLQEYFESMATEILLDFEKYYKLRKYNVSYPLLILSIKKGLEYTNEKNFNNYIKKTEEIIHQAITTHKGIINHNSGINKSCLELLFTSYGILIEEDGGVLSRLYSNLLHLSNIRHEGAHGSMKLGQGFDHTPNTLRTILEEIIVDIDDFTKVIENFILESKQLFATT